MSENCAETRPSFLLTPAGRGTALFSWYWWDFPPIRWQKSSSRSRRLLNTTGAGKPKWKSQIRRSMIKLTTTVALLAISLTCASLKAGVIT